MRNKQISDRVISALISVQLLFGMNYIFSKIVLGHLPPLLWASARAAITAIILLVITACQGAIDFPRVKQCWKELLLFSLLGVALNQGAFLMGLKYTSAINSSLLNTLIPIFTILLVTLLGQEESSRKRQLGFLFAFVGILVLHRIEKFTSSNATLMGDLLTLLNAFFYSLFLVFSQKFFQRNNFLWATTWLFVFGSVGLSLFAANDWLTYEWHPVPAEAILCAGITVIFGSIIPYLLISYTLGKTQSSLVALFVYLQPLVASVLSYLFFREAITARTIAAGALIFLGVFLAISDRRKTGAASDRQPSTESPGAKVLPLRRRR
jgi:drug/metabolite transporter (DMT)-like permease